MSTSYEKIYDFFLLKVNDYSFLNLQEADLYNQLQKYMVLAISKFRKCKKDLTNRDDTLKQFNVELTDAEKDILASLMILEYLKPEILRSNLLRQSMTDRDFKIYSQANHIDQLIKLYNHEKDEVYQRINDYSYYSNSLDDLR